MAYNSGKQIIKLVEADLKPSDILTQEAFNNAITVDMALGGSSNTALHIPAIANEIEGVEVNLEDVIADIIKRDEIDSNREFAPLVKADDAIEIDTTGKTIDDVVKAVIEKIQ